MGLFYLLRGVETPDVAPTEQEIAALPPSDERRRAYETFAVHNVRLVYKTAQAFRVEGFDEEDVAQYGMLGLMRAVVKFDGRQGTKFSTYAIWWIRQSIDRYTKDDAGPIRFPVHVHENLAKLTRAEHRLQDRGRFPTAVNVALESGLTVDSVIAMRKASWRVDSLDRQIRGDTPLMELIANDPRDAIPSTEEAVVEQAQREEVRALLTPLKEREKQIVELRMGLTGDDPQTLGAIGERFGVTRERIRQLEKKALTEIAERLGVAPGKPRGRRRRAK
ncbi:sigma-70 family RNA polymerase sigma factor [Nocardiopsis quinghaiensis]|uniref:sigma-70 family RNA polymerase sigma factor n=1 Tax=Nocardiopsis quinghaiensis TaxID=464995 RepID=UPI001CC22BC0|nr:sigma-70 family RNA polymerase sigma factor [Nocardiopsis quinghaiensis]